MTYTTEEKTEWKATMRGLVSQVSKMTPEERQAFAARMPIITCEGHPLSLFNQCYLLIQQSNGTILTIVGGFRQWKKAARTVVSGAKSIGYIYVPMGNGKREDEEEDREVNFRLVPVFDIAQTEEIH